MPLKPKPGLKNDGLFKPNYFKVKVRLDQTKEVFPFKIYNELKVRDMKCELEFLTGIPTHIQKVWYLDEGELQPDTDVRQNNIVPDALLHIDIRYTWHNLIDAVCNNDVTALMKQGVTPNTDFTSPALEYQGRWFPKLKKQTMADRAQVALYMASHRGLLDMVTKLLRAGSNVNATTPHKRSALHVAAARGHGDVMDVLLERGANATKEDEDGETPSSIALKYGHKDCDRHLFMFKWQQRAKKPKKIS